MNSCTYKFYESKAVHIPLKYVTEIQKKNYTKSDYCSFQEPYKCKCKFSGNANRARRAKAWYLPGGNINLQYGHAHKA